MKKATKSILGVTGAAVIAASTFVPAMVYAWGDNSGSAKGRPSYTLDEINSGAIDDKITFNSISNQSVSIGDEKNFVGAKVAGQTVTTWNADTIKVEDGQTYTIRLYVHNNNPYYIYCLNCFGYSMLNHQYYLLLHNVHKLIYKQYE